MTPPTRRTTPDHDAGDALRGLFSAVMLSLPVWLVLAFAIRAWAR